MSLDQYNHVVNRFSIPLIWFPSLNFAVVFLVYYLTSAVQRKYGATPSFTLLGMFVLLMTIASLVTHTGSSVLNFWFMKDILPPPDVPSEWFLLSWALTFGLGLLGGLWQDKRTRISSLALELLIIWVAGLLILNICFLVLVGAQWYVVALGVLAGVAMSALICKGVRRHASR